MLRSALDVQMALAETVATNTKTARTTAQTARLGGARSVAGKSTAARGSATLKGRTHSGDRRELRSILTDATH